MGGHTLKSKDCNPGKPWNDVELFPTGPYVGEGTLGGEVEVVNVGGQGGFGGTPTFVQLNKTDGSDGLPPAFMPPGFDSDGHRVDAPTGGCPPPKKLAEDPKLVSHFLQEDFQFCYKLDTLDELLEKNGLKPKAPKPTSPSGDGLGDDPLGPDPLEEGDPAGSDLPRKPEPPVSPKKPISAPAAPKPTAAPPQKPPKSTPQQPPPQTVKTFKVNGSGVVGRRAAPTVATVPPRARAGLRTLDLTKRAEREAQGHPCVHRLTISEYHGHSARSVCNSESSYGPDFVSTAEGVFCDMCDKQSYNLCDWHKGGETDEMCFHLETRTLKVGGKVSRIYKREDFGIKDKRYRDISHWK
jgi:hypothetical protein